MQTKKKENLLFYLLLLTGFFLLIEISFFIQCNKIYLSDFASVSDAPEIPITILPGVLYFIAAQLFLHLIYCVSVWGVVLAVTQLFRVPAPRKFYWALVTWFLGILTILLANQYFFPNSKFSEISSLVFFHPSLTVFCLVLCAGFCLLMLFFTAIYFFKRVLKKPIWLGSLVMSLMAIMVFFQERVPLHPPAATKDKPNIILIGVDALRPDFLSYFGHDTKTPFFDSFLTSATIFSDAVTPLARTFPSWTSILTGEYPRQHGARSNLVSQHHLNLENTLPAILKRHGYETIYATDETRFSNIDRNFGFERIITPPIGLNDFLLGTFNDFPLSNLLINTWLGKILFPYSYGNRPVFFTYEPDSFIKLLKPVLKEERPKPLFLAVHFCLPHFPYAWAGLSTTDMTMVERYQASMTRVDQQVRDFYQLLENYRLLDHAIVVLLSDHGEAFELAGDRITEKALFVGGKEIPAFYPASLAGEEVNQSVGHGGDVLGLSQYRTLLAFKLYGVTPQARGVIPGTVTLLNIKPTVLQLIGIENEQSIALSLAKRIGGQLPSSALVEHVFIESDFTPEAIRTVYPETRKVLLEGVQLFQVDPVTTRLTMKPAMESMVIKSKQYADIYGDWMLALYPQEKGASMPILINLKNHQWTNDLNSTFAQQSPAKSMLLALKKFYGNEINHR